MAVRFILGRSGSGKTHYCLEAIRAELKRSPQGAPLLYLVPEQATFQMEQALLRDRELAGYHRARVMSFQRWARRVLWETGPPHLPLLSEFGKQMTIIEPKVNKKDFKKGTVFHLGVDVGSTTTKAVLVDPEDSSVVASYYGRTNGNPIEATKNCVNEIISQVGNQKISLVGVTGSGRSIVGAYLGTPAIYNEISAHSQGAVFYDPEVDTIFEIGGQDSKYMFLQNSVPVDYAMNATCSAGTGSFLEESAKGDLGISVFDISKTAIDAKNPVRFKADCAAFINTDILSLIHI